MTTHGRTPACIKHAAWVTCILVVWISSASFADEIADSAFKNSLQPGSWSLQFKVDRDFHLTHFEGASISCKRHYSDKSAIRLGLGLSASSLDGDAEVFDQNSEAGSSMDRDDNGMAFDMSALYLYYPAPGNRVNLFFGVGPDIGYSRSKSERANQSYRDTLQSEDWRSVTSSSIGLDAKGVLGVEWFATENISLLSEYACIAGYRHSTSKSEATYKGQPHVKTSESTNNSFRLGHSEVKFGLSVYF